MTSGEQVTVDGVWLASIAGVGELTWSHAADGGCESASWSMDLGPAFNHPSLRAGNIVAIRLGAANIWQGILDEPDRAGDGWTFNAAGLSTDARGYLCLASDGLSPVSTPDTAIDQAIARGGSMAGVTRPASLSSVPFAATDSTVTLNTLGDLLDVWATNNSKRWGIDANAQLTARSDPTLPTWYLSPGSGKIGLADDDYVSDLYGRFWSAFGVYNTVHVADSTASTAHRREAQVDLINLGITTSGIATATLNGMLAKGAARYNVTDTLTVAQSQITTPGGQPACLSFVKAGDMARLWGALNEQGTPTAYFDFVIGRTEYTAGEKTISIAPVGLAARNLTDVLTLAVA